MANQESPTRRPDSQKAPEVRKPEVTKKAEKVIYLGPAMLERGTDSNVLFSISYGTIFSNGVPKNVAERMEIDKDFAKLFVPVNNAANAMKDLMKPNSDLATVHSKISKDYRDRKKVRR